MSGQGEGHNSEARLNREEAEVPQQQGNQREREGRNRGERAWIRPYLGMMPTEENLRFIETNRILFLSGKTEVEDPL